MTAGVIHLRSSIGLYGAEHMLLGLCSEQARRGAAPTLAAFDHGRDLLDRAAQRGLPTLALPCTGPIDLRCVARLRMHLRQAALQGARLLHCHDYKSVVYGWLASRGLGFKRVATMHGWLPGDARLRAYRMLETRLLRGFDRVCAVSAPIAEQLAAAGVRERRVRRIDNGIDLLRFRASDPPPGARGTLRLGCAARLSPEKGLDRLIDAVAEVRARGREVRLTVHGEGELRGALEAQVARLGLSDVVSLPGNRDDLEHWYPQLDAFVLASLTEGMPLTVLEALACGTPVVATDVGSLAGMLQGLPGCHVLPPGDPIALAATLFALPTREHAALALRERVEQRFSVARMADAYERVYDEALAA